MKNSFSFFKTKVLVAVALATMIATIPLFAEDSSAALVNDNSTNMNLNAESEAGINENQKKSKASFHLSLEAMLCKARNFYYANYHLRGPMLLVSSPIIGLGFVPFMARFFGNDWIFVAAYPVSIPAYTLWFGGEGLCMTLYEVLDAPEQGVEYITYLLRKKKII